MAKGKHITLNDINEIFKREAGGLVHADEEKMLEPLQHLAVCSECAERVKAHRRMEILLDNWSPELHGQAFRKAEALRKAQEERQAAAAAEEDDGHQKHDHDDHDHGDHSHDGHHHHHGHSHNHNGECDCGKDCAEDCDDCDD